MTRLLLFPLSLLFLAACTGSGRPSSESITGSWKLQDVAVSAETTGGSDPLLQEAENKEDVKNGVLLSIFEDGTYSEVRGPNDYTTGTWKYTDESKQTISTDKYGLIQLVPGNSTTRIHLLQLTSRQARAYHLCNPRDR